MNYGITNLWPTPVMLEQITETALVDSAVQEIFANCNLDSPPSDFQKFDVLQDVPGLRDFKDLVVVPTFEKYFREVFDIDLKSLRYNTRSWIAGASAGYMIPVHNHSGAVVSGVFYLLCEEHASGGELHMIDPRTNANRGYTGNLKKLFDPVTYSPSSNEAIIFPSFMYHYTLPFTGNMRLAMPVDLFVSD